MRSLPHPALPVRLSHTTPFSCGGGRPANGPGAAYGALASRLPEGVALVFALSEGVRTPFNEQGRVDWQCLSLVGYQRASPEAPRSVRAGVAGCDGWLVCTGR